jgi:hypothetical protein
MPMINKNEKQLTNAQTSLKMQILSEWQGVARDLGTSSIRSSASVDWLRDELGEREWETWSDEDKGVVFKHITGKKW